MDGESYRSFVVRVWYPAGDGTVPRRIEIEEVQSGSRVAVSGPRAVEVISGISTAFGTWPECNHLDARQPQANDPAAPDEDVDGRCR